MADELTKQEKLRMAKEYPYPSRMNANVSRMESPPPDTRPIKKKMKPYQYVYGTPDENIEKTAKLKAYAALDPGIGLRIKALTNQLVARAANTPSWQPEKDLYALGQDAYLIEMGRMGVRGAHQKARS